MNDSERQDIQKCKNVMKNVLNYELNVRQFIIKNALANLNFVSSH